MVQREYATQVQAALLIELLAMTSTGKNTQYYTASCIAHRCDFEEDWNALLERDVPKLFDYFIKREFVLRVEIRSLRRKKAFVGYMANLQKQEEIKEFIRDNSRAEDFVKDRRRKI